MFVYKVMTDHFTSYLGLKKSSEPRLVLLGGTSGSQSATKQHRALLLLYVVIVHLEACREQLEHLTAVVAFLFLTPSAMTQLLGLLTTPAVSDLSVPKALLLI